MRIVINLHIIGLLIVAVALGQDNGYLLYTGIGILAICAITTIILMITAIVKAGRE